MKRVPKGGVGAVKPPPAESAGLVAAYREGLGLVCIAIICEAEGLRIAAIGSGVGDPYGEANVQIRLWCRRTADAERIASAATLRMRRLASREGGPSSSMGLVGDDSPRLSLAHDAVLAAARRLNVLLQSDDEIADEAALVAARVDAVMQRLQRSGELKSVNGVYRDCRIKATECGERIVCYVEWMRKYKENLIRQAASALRDL